MFIRKNEILFYSLVIFLLATNPVLAESPNPRNTVKSLLDSIKKIKTGDDLSAKQKMTNQRNSRFALSKLNIPGVGRKALGKYWKKRTPKEQKTFLVILSQLFEKFAFPNSGKFFADLNITYGTGKEKNSRAIIPITVIHKDEGELDIEFILEKVGEKWLVGEVILDGVSMRNNLRSQFYKIISKNSYRELIQRMTNKLKNAEKEG